MLPQRRGDLHVATRRPRRTGVYMLELAVRSHGPLARPRGGGARPGACPHGSGAQPRRFPMAAAYGRGELARRRRVCDGGVSGGDAAALDGVNPWRRAGTASAGRRAYRPGTAELSPRNAVPKSGCRHGSTTRHGTTTPSCPVVPCPAVPCLTMPVSCRAWAARLAMYGGG
jgi:hypothetical protein